MEIVITILGIIAAFILMFNFGAHKNESEESKDE